MTKPVEIYSVGLEVTEGFAVIFLIFIVAAAVGHILIAFKESRDSNEIWKFPYFVLVGFLVLARIEVLPLAAIIGLMYVVFNTLGILFEGLDLASTVFASEFTSGIFPMRIVAVIVLWRASASIPTKRRQQQLYERILGRRPEEEANGVNVVPNAGDAEQITRAIHSQYVFYAVAAAIAFFAASSGYSDWKAIALSWATLFVVDDFIIVHDYAYWLTGGIVRKSHKRRIDAFNAFIFVLLTLIAFEIFPVGAALACAALLSFLALEIYAEKRFYQVLFGVSERLSSCRDRSLEEWKMALRRSQGTKEKFDA